MVWLTEKPSAGNKGSNKKQQRNILQKEENSSTWIKRWSQRNVSSSEKGNSKLYITSDRQERFKSSEKVGNGRSGFICLRQDASGSKV